ncbi:hypothetical protein ANO11243_037660 [Dothideomycetidae sp. 11243]|nr:hypothetical protein ANO11243_037660 [fungal sp. No.11243]
MKAWNSAALVIALLATRIAASRGSATEPGKPEKPNQPYDIYITADSTEDLMVPQIPWSVAEKVEDGLHTLHWSLAEFKPSVATTVSQEDHQMHIIALGTPGNLDEWSDEVDELIGTHLKGSDHVAWTSKKRTKPGGHGSKGKVRHTT